VEVIVVIFQRHYKRDSVPVEEYPSDWRKDSEQLDELGGAYLVVLRIHPSNRLLKAVFT
jgi:hypothetical protein